MCDLLRVVVALFWWSDEQTQPYEGPNHETCQSNWSSGSQSAAAHICVTNDGFRFIAKALDKDHCVHGQGSTKDREKESGNTRG